MDRISKGKKEWHEQYRKLLRNHHPTKCARCGIGGSGWSHQGGTFEPHHPFKRTSREFMCTFLPLCPHCHRWIHDHTKQAREDGWLVTPAKPDFPPIH